MSNAQARSQARLSMGLWGRLKEGEGKQNRASILQVAWRQELIIFDLLWMHRVECTCSSSAREVSSLGPLGPQAQGAGVEGRVTDWQHGEVVTMSHVLAKLLTSEWVLKLGFDFATDLAKLKASYPEVSFFFSHVCACLRRRLDSSTHTAVLTPARIRPSSLSHMRAPFYLSSDCEEAGARTLVVRQGCRAR